MYSKLYFSSTVISLYIYHHSDNSTPDIYADYADVSVVNLFVLFQFRWHSVVSMNLGMTGQLKPNKASCDLIA